MHLFLSGFETFKKRPWASEGQSILTIYGLLARLLTKRTEKPSLARMNSRSKVLNNGVTAHQLPLLDTRHPVPSFRGIHSLRSQDTKLIASKLEISSRQVMPDNRRSHVPQARRFWLGRYHRVCNFTPLGPSNTNLTSSSLGNSALSAAYSTGHSTAS